MQRIVGISPRWGLGWPNFDLFMIGLVDLLSFCANTCITTRPLVLSPVPLPPLTTTTQSQFIVNPKPFLSDLTGKAVRVRLKWGQEYQGILSSSDAYMNLRLDKTEEFVDGEFAGFLGEVLIRCNNVLYIKAAPSGGAQKMEE